ncbi:hypothetical protein JK191_02000 [Gluconobacter sphaericus]|uniref:hypothetical protein n=1 Tax=Gluconobacter sphaericus TaxID=574987 RepID=UPI001B8A919D|nr:hypothetical protein [Gluconobacter sphaericus]MBS1096363.1 hypothetical protein [Gluconobacter sphaericus]
MTQTFRSRDEQEKSAAKFLEDSGYKTDHQIGFCSVVALLVSYAEKAEARGAAEEQGKDRDGSLRPMSEAKKDRTPILAKIHDDLFPRIRPERKDLEPWNGRWVVVSHPGILEDGFDLGWGVAAPVGHGGFPDDWFVGWKPLEYSANVAASEARIAELEEEVAKLNGGIRNPDDVTCALMDSQYVAGAKFGWNCAQDDDPESLTKMIERRLRDRIEAGVSFSDRSRDARAALKREGGV